MCTLHILHEYTGTPLPCRICCVNTIVREHFGWEISRTEIFKGMSYSPRAKVPLQMTIIKKRQDIIAVNFDIRGSNSKIQQMTMDLNHPNIYIYVSVKEKKSREYLHVKF